MQVAKIAVDVPVFELIESGKLDVKQLITHRLTLEEADRGLQLMDEKAEEVMKGGIVPAHRMTRSGAVLEIWKEEYPAGDRAPGAAVDA